MNYEIVELEEKIVEGIWIKTTNENNQSMQDIGELWKRFFEQGVYNKIEGKVNNKTIGLYTEYEKDYTMPYDFMVGVEVKNKADEKKVKIIPKGKYAKFVITGDVQKAVGELWDSIWQMDLDRKYTCDFEEYQNNSQNLQEQEIHVYIAIH